MAGQGEKNNEADVRLLFSRKEVFPLSFASSPHIGNKAKNKRLLLSLSRFGNSLFVLNRESDKKEYVYDFSADEERKQNDYQFLHQTHCRS